MEVGGGGQFFVKFAKEKNNNVENRAGVKDVRFTLEGCIMLSRDINVAFPSKVVWDSTVPQKVGIFSWEAT